MPHSIQRLCFALLSVIAGPLNAQVSDADEQGRRILLDMRDSLLAHGTMSYTVQLRIKYPFGTDTTDHKARVKVQRDVSDTLFGGKIMLMFEDETVIYEGRFIHECSTRTDSCTRYHVAKHETWPLTAGQNGVLWSREMTKPDRITKRCATAENVVWAGDTLMDGNLCDRVHLRFPDQGRITGHEALYTVSRADRTALVREERYVQEGEVLWYRWAISDVLFDTPGGHVPTIGEFMPSAVIADYASPEFPPLLGNGVRAPLLIGDLAGSGPKADTVRYEGKITFIDFWSVGCAPCRHSMPVIDSLHVLYADRRVQFIGANPYDGIEKLNTFKQKHGIQYPTLHMERGAQDAFNVTAIPAFYLVDALGRVAASWIGYGPGVESSWVEAIEKLLAQ